MWALAYNCHLSLICVLEDDLLFVNFTKFHLEWLHLDFWHRLNHHLHKIGQLSMVLTYQSKEDLFLLRFGGVVTDIQFRAFWRDCDGWWYFEVEIITNDPVVSSRQDNSSTCFLPLNSPDPDLSLNDVVYLYDHSVSIYILISLDDELSF